MLFHDWFVCAPLQAFVPVCSHWTQEKVAKLYRKFRGPLMLKYLKELAANDQAMASMAVCNGHFSIFFLVEG